MFNKRAPVFQQRLVTFFFVFQGNLLEKNGSCEIENYLVLIVHSQEWELVMHIINATV